VYVDTGAHSDRPFNIGGDCDAYRWGGFLRGGEKSGVNWWMDEWLFENGSLMGWRVGDRLRMNMEVIALNAI
jgi:hypothetical protein